MTVFLGVRFVFIFLLFVLKFSNALSALDTAEFNTIYLDKSCIIYPDIDPTTGVGISNLSAKYARPLTTRIIECIDGTLSGLFLKANPNTSFTLFQEFQVAVKPLVILILILYVASNGYLIALGKGLAEKPKQEILLFLIKFILVFYFAVGDAWKDFFFNALRSVAGTLGTILIEAGVNTYSDGCIFTGRGMLPYPAGKGYLAIFDTLDCKFANYMGWFVGRKFPLIVPLAFLALFLGATGTVIFTIAFVLTFQLIIIAARVAQLYLLSITMLTLLIYASPIIVPMVLFDYTKGMFDQWLNRVLGLMVHPLLVFAFLGILLSITDRIYYGATPDESELFTQPASKSLSSEGMQEAKNTSQIVPGNDVNSNCYPQFASIVSAVKLPLVCAVRRLEEASWEYRFPIPGFLEIIPILLPKPKALPYFLPLAITSLICIILNLIIGYIFEKLQDLIASISEIDELKGMGKFVNMVEGTIKAGQGAASGMRNAQDAILKRQSAAGGDKKEANSSGGGGGKEASSSGIEGGKQTNSGGAEGGGKEASSSGGGGEKETKSSGIEGGKETNSGGTDGGGASEAASSGTGT